MSVVHDLVADMSAEAASLDDLVAGLDATGWATPTPAEGWTIAHQIGHLWWTDRMATLSATDPSGFDDMLVVAANDPATFVDAGAAEAAQIAPADLLARWREGRAAVAEALVSVPDGTKLAWFGPPMSAASMATARIMETWAHGLDVADTLGVRRLPTARLRNVAHIGVRTRDFAYILNGRTPPTTPLRVELTAPDGATWEWGPADADNRVIGSAEDFCRLVTQRRAAADLDLAISGADAVEWSQIAQCFAGAPGTGRAPLGADSTAGQR
ncbi:TIGR03084 family metal-binding protein [Williamsia herbipolensis]|uniref:TIGR03084 family metal-binding protein n=1 Tax=Williamsia herbipolensis TaxID=1603258 RepID=A0AAU4K6F9_9NOCA|nr:TIGR03084 family metal-binding protein [Williamsia herbipolensis]